MYGIPTFDSESFELELTWDASGGTSGSSIRPNPFSVFGDHVSPHVHHERTTLKKTTKPTALGVKIYVRTENRNFLFGKPTYGCSDLQWYG